DLDMYKHPSTQSTFETLERFGNIMIPAATGELASGLHGEGRMAEPEDIFSFIQDYLSGGLPLSGKRVLITAGPTYEAIDPVRFIGNHSSGKMGYALAEVAADLGAEVILVSGPSHLGTTHHLIKVISVVSAEEMYLEVHKYYDRADIAICAAAVADYRPVEIADQKLKKTEDRLTIDLVKNKDILLSLGEKKKDQFLVGFALETQNELENAQGKLKKKQLDAIVLNSLKDAGAGFGKNTNKITFIDKNLEIKTFDVKTKSAVAVDIWNEILKRTHA
ncbi:MAG: bifunctional phosphopantothenoylcysteine decarboxylase/phosphopantothenate--cysteine ligase CoaBC, partial [Eudoraea sp.]|nr:bifunctional phosphopantothenoylcysteine decarboxylase/phosphopantothenate--cysteine ligase CoaBC [Eudoraea sp.]